MGTRSGSSSSTSNGKWLTRTGMLFSFLQIGLILYLVVYILERVIKNETLKGMSFFAWIVPSLLSIPMFAWIIDRKKWGALPVVASVVVIGTLISIIVLVEWFKKGDDFDASMSPVTATIAMILVALSMVTLTVWLVLREKRSGGSRGADAADVFTAVSTALSTVAALGVIPAVLKTFEAGDHGTSEWYLCLSTAGSVVLLAYGIMSRTWPFVSYQGTSLIQKSIRLWGAWSYNKSRKIRAKTGKQDRAQRVNGDDHGPVTTEEKKKNYTVPFSVSVSYAVLGVAILGGAHMIDKE